jgi:type II secretory pathway pseudopilin PulG
MRAQQGFFMLELIMAAIIATLLAVWGAHSLVNRINDASAQSAAAWMLVVKKAASSYIERYAVELTQSDDALPSGLAGYSDWSAPLLTELKADNLLSSSFPESIKLGKGASIKLMRQGSCPGTACRVSALVYSNAPFITHPDERVDEQMVAQWTMAAQGWGGSVSTLRPDRISGAAFDLPNPPAEGPPFAAGTVALAITAEQLGTMDFLRVRDTRNPDFQGAVTVKGDIDSQTDLRAARYVHVGAAEGLLQACAQDGAVALNAEGGLLVCRNNVWRSSSRTGGGGYSTILENGCQSDTAQVTVNPVTGTCSCPKGSTAVLIADSGDRPTGRLMGFLCVD